MCVINIVVNDFLIKGLELTVVHMLYSLTFWFVRLSVSSTPVTQGHEGMKLVHKGL